MPRKDPITGCMVMTLPEFAKAEGYNSAGEMLEEVWDEMDADCKKWERHLMEHPEEVMEMFQKYYKDFNDDTYKKDIPKKHIQTLYVSSSQGFRKEGHTVVAAFKCRDGKIKIQMLQHSYWSGTRMEPPEEDEWVEIF